MSDLDIIGLIASFGFAMSVFGFFYGTIYASKQFAKFDKRISDLEAANIKTKEAQNENRNH